MRRVGPVDPGFGTDTLGADLRRPRVHCEAALAAGGRGTGRAARAPRPGDPARPGLRGTAPQTHAGTADGLLCTQFLEHTARPENLLGEIWRVLKPGGSLVMTAPF